MATILRRLLDDAHMSVVTAAAEAMAVLVGPGPEEEEVWEAAHCNPATGRRTCDCAGMMTKRQNTGIIALGREFCYLCPTCCVFVKLLSLCAWQISTRAAPMQARETLVLSLVPNAPVRKSWRVCSLSQTAKKLVT